MESNYFIDQVKAEIQRGLTIPEFQINDVVFLPNSQRYLASIDARINGKIEILTAREKDKERIIKALQFQYDTLHSANRTARFAHVLKPFVQ